MAYDNPKYFTFAELTKTAQKFTNIPTDWKTLDNLRRLGCFLDRIRERFGKAIRVNCAYRSPEVNAAVGGVATSAHLHGLAADICAWSGTEVDNRLLLAILESSMERAGSIDQLISYHRTQGHKEAAIRFIHVGLAPEDEDGIIKNRGQRLYK